MNVPTDKEVRDWYMGIGVPHRAELAEVEGKAFDRYLELRDANSYGEGIAWERKRWEMLLEIEDVCSCVDTIEHLKKRVARTEYGMNIQDEFQDS